MYEKWNFLLFHCTGNLFSLIVNKIKAIIESVNTTILKSKEIKNKTKKNYKKLIAIMN